LSQEFGDEFDTAIKQRYGSEIRSRDRTVDLGYKNNEGAIYSSEIYQIFSKVLNQPIDILFDDMPTFFYKQPIEPIRTRSFVSRHNSDYVVDLSFREWSH
jgi:hypothetical protein